MAIGALGAPVVSMLQGTLGTEGFECPLRPERDRQNPGVQETSLRNQDPTSTELRRAAGLHAAQPVPAPASAWNLRDLKSLGR